MSLTRRDMLKLTAGGAAAWMTGIQWADSGLAAMKNQIPLGLELWSVRHQCQQDLPTVLEAVSEMGYASVELAHSYYGYDAAAWQELLKKNNLKSCGMHMGLDALEGDAFAKTVEIHKTLGTPYLIIASLPHNKRDSVSAIMETAQQFNQLSERLQEHGMQIGYHCHGADFAKLGEKTIWEVFGENTHRDVILQLDIGNCLGGGGDPIAMLKKFPGRGVSIHLKDHGGKPGAVFGEGVVDWPKVFQICEETAGTKQYVIEEEGQKGPAAIKSVRRAVENYRKMTQ